MLVAVAIIILLIIDGVVKNPIYCVVEHFCSLGIPYVWPLSQKYPIYTPLRGTPCISKFLLSHPVTFYEFIIIRFVKTIQAEQDSAAVRTIFGIKQMKTTVPLQEAVGMVLPHDITEIRRGSFKGRAFKKGHIIREEDIPHLKKLGKEHIYILRLAEDEIHENEAALELAAALAGPGTACSDEPTEGKINLMAAHDGILKINKDNLYHFNLLGEVMCSTLHTNTPVRKGEQIAAARLIPLTAKRSLVRQAVEIAGGEEKIVRVLPVKKARAALVITGNEVYKGRIKDGFEPVLRRKLGETGSEVIDVQFAPDDVDTIARNIQHCLENGADLIVTTGGMSVDPDDVTRLGILQAGACDIVYGTPVLPGAMFLVGYINSVPVLGLPACSMFHKITVLDLILPRVLAGEKIGREDLAELGHGGLCRQCKICRYPSCGFGK